jgi:hypothetical protein
MNQEQLSITYELISNPILRLLVYFGAAAIAGLASACIYLYRDRASAYRELLQVNNEQTRAFTMIGASLTAIDEKMQELTAIVTNHLLNKKP